jgi:5-methylcytosine-specific restriction endonuclease McrA
MQVFVLDSNRKPLTPCHAAVARKLMRDSKAAILRFKPFTIILKRGVENTPRPLRLKIDPGSKVTGFAIVDDQAKRIVYAAELEHRGQSIKRALDERRIKRCSRRNRKTRYRKPRFLNRYSSIRKGLKAPSILHRVYTVKTWVNRFRKYTPIGAISLELVRFDMQKMQNPEISGIEYQQGELAGYELREYLLEKWQRKCAYCSAENVPLQIEHIKAKTNGGTNRASNLTLACEKCNIGKGAQPIEKFLAKKPEILKRILAQAKTPLKDAAAVNSTRWAIFEMLKRFDLPIECGTGGRTKFNRIRNGHRKTHFLDAANVGASTPIGLIANVHPLLIKAIGYGTRQMQNVDKYGFPCGTARHRKKTNCFSRGDLVKAIVTKGKYKGRHIGIISAVKFDRRVDLKTAHYKFTTPSKNLCKHQNADGFHYKNTKSSRTSSSN